MNENNKALLQGEVIGVEIEILSEEDIADEDISEAKDVLEDKAMGRQNIIMDSQSKRSIDRNGYMHMELCNITKESVDPHFGRERFLRKRRISEYYKESG